MSRKRVFDEAVGPETPMQAFNRRRRWRRDDVRLAWIRIARARAFNRGKKRLGAVPVYAHDASEEQVQAAIRLLNLASWDHHAC